MTIPIWFMKQMVMDNHKGPYIPLEIVRNILLRLPVKSLKRFECVCKDWKDLVNAPSFIAEHLRLSTNKQNYLLFLNLWDEPDFCLLNHEMKVFKFQKPPFIEAIKEWSIVNSSNGLICFRITDKSESLVFLWNPATREVCQVPKALKLYGDDHYPVGFGFSSVLNDYKIVRLFVSSYWHSVRRAEVYSLSQGSWKEVDVGNSKDISCISREGITCNGATFWFGFKRDMEGESGHNLIVSFDLTKEVFALIEMPTLSLEPSRCNHTLTIFDNKLAIFHRRGFLDPESSSVDLWVMEESNWTKKCTINPYPHFLQPVAIWRDEIISRVCVSPYYLDASLIGLGATVLFNLLTYEMETCTMWRFSVHESISNYVESLVPVGNIHVKERRYRLYHKFKSTLLECWKCYLE